MDMKPIIMLLIALPIAMTLAIAAAADEIDIQGRVEQIDQSTDADLYVWIRPTDASPIRVTMPTDLGIPSIGDEILLKAVSTDPIADRARDGGVYTWPTARASSWERVVSPQQGAGGVLAILVAVLAVIFVAVLLAGRAWMRPTPSLRRTVLGADWEMESTDLPEDAPAALAELARRADEVDK